MENLTYSAAGCTYMALMTGKMAMNSANWTRSATPPMPVTLRSGGMRALFTERTRIRTIRMAVYAFMRRMSVWDRMEGIISITA